MSASTPLFQATIEPDEDPANAFPSGNIGSSGGGGRSNGSAPPVVLTPGAAPSHGSGGGNGASSGDAELGLVSLTRCLKGTSFLIEYHRAPG